MKKLAFTIFVFFTMTACVTTEYKIFQGEDNVFVGKGGAMIMVDGMEIWDYGEPPRKYKVLGFIEDERSGPFTMSKRNLDVVRKAREVGGDAVIKPSNQSQIDMYYPAGSVGVYSSSGHYSSTGIGASISIPLNKNISSFVVIKFLD